MSYKDPNLIEEYLESSCPECGQETLVLLKHKDGELIFGGVESQVHCTQCEFEEDGKAYDKRMNGIGN